MLVNPREMLRRAQLDNYAIGAFNTYNLEITLGILHAAQELNAPVMLQVGASALEYGEAPLGALAMAAAESASVPMAVHLDHARDMEVLKACLSRGFTSVMFDGSLLPLEENIKRTREAALLAHASGIPIEGELGAVGGTEDPSTIATSFKSFTDPVHVERYVSETSVDSLAVAIGNAHGFYKSKPDLDYQRLEAIRKRTRVPLVLHGASGISDQDIIRAVQKGICKINVNTEIRCAFFDMLQEKQVRVHRNYDLQDLLTPAIEAVSSVVKRKITLFGSDERGLEQSKCH